MRVRERRGERRREGERKGGSMPFFFYFWSLLSLPSKNVLLSLHFFSCLFSSLSSLYYSFFLPPALALRTISDLTNLFSSSLLSISQKMRQKEGRRDDDHSFPFLSFPLLSSYRGCLINIGSCSNQHLCHFLAIIKCGDVHGRAPVLQLRERSWERER